MVDQEDPRTAGSVPNSCDSAEKESWDHGAHEAFLEYYAGQSLTETTRLRSTALRDLILREWSSGAETRLLDVADIGCGPGTQAMVWAMQGHRVHGLDVSVAFIDLARARAKQAALDIEFRVGSATDLPWADESMDACLAPELLEHVVGWKRSLDEFCRILRPGGVLYLSTTNALCPKQEEFNLPLYSWYPGWLKRRCERLATSSRPEIASHAKYPAVNWFTPYGLRRELDRRGLSARDRFDLIDLTERSSPVRLALHAIRALPPARFLGHMLTPYTVVLGKKRHFEPISDQ